MYTFNIIGLGKMGLNLYQNMIDNNVKVRGFDVSSTQRKKCTHQEFILNDFEDMFDDGSNIYWMMLPSGHVTEEVFQSLLKKAKCGDIIIDAGNAHYRDSINKYELTLNKGIGFLDVGVSGGQAGARENTCMMLGGDKDVFEKVEQSLLKICEKDGLLHVGAAGSGHYLKMIHNGIEYGIMQSISEGFNILNHSDLYNFDKTAIAKLFNSGSVIRSWLMELAYNALSGNENLENIVGVVNSSGEGKWTVEEALRLQLNIPVISQSLFARYSSQDKDKFGEKLTSSLRNQFGGHELPENE